MNLYQRSLLLLLLCCTLATPVMPGLVLAQETPTTAAPPKGPVTVGSKEFTEQLLLGKMLILLLQDADYAVTDKTGLGGV